jgi:hypothetical protein
MFEMLYEKEKNMFGQFDSRTNRSSREGVQRSGEQGSRSHQPVDMIRLQAGAIQRQQAQREVPRNRRIQMIPLSDMLHNPAYPTPTTDLANIVSPRDYEDNRYLRKDLYMLTRLNISSLIRVDDNFIHTIQNSNLNIITKTQILKFAQSINKIKDYGEYKGSITCIDACKAVNDTKDAVDTLRNIPGMQIPAYMGSIGELLNRIESDYNTTPQQVQQQQYRQEASTSSEQQIGGSRENRFFHGEGTPEDYNKELYGTIEEIREISFTDVNRATYGPRSDRRHWQNKIDSLTGLIANRSDIRGTHIFNSDRFAEEWIRTVIDAENNYKDALLDCMKRIMASTRRRYSLAQG